VIRLIQQYLKESNLLKTLQTLQVSTDTFQRITQPIIHIFRRKLVYP